MNSNRGKRDEGKNGADLQYLVGRTRGLASVSRGNGEKETACGCIAICFL